MSVLTENRLIYGKIYTQGQEFHLLNLKPATPIEIGLREYCLAFEVADDFGTAKTLIVTKGNFAIIPEEPRFETIRYELEDVQEPISIPVEIPTE